jgi:hypothetical protein
VGDEVEDGINALCGREVSVEGFKVVGEDGVGGGGDLRCRD